MKALWIVMRKELLDAFRDRRMVLMAFLVMPLAVPSLLAGMSAVGVRKQLQKLEATLELPDGIVVVGVLHPEDPVPRLLELEGVELRVEGYQKVRLPQPRLATKGIGVVGDGRRDR